MEEEVKVRYRGEEITLRVPAGTSEADIQAFLERQSAASPAAAPAAPARGSQPGAVRTAVNAMGQALTSFNPALRAMSAPPGEQAGMASAANTAMFGVPEMLARSLGAGPQIERAREQYPMETGAGDVIGLAGPAAAGYQMAGRLGSLFRKPTTATLSTAPGSQVISVRPPTPALSRAASAGARTAFGAVPTMQVAGGLSAAARNPENPTGAAVQGSTMVGQSVANAPLLRQIPGYSAAAGEITQAVPGAFALGGARLEQYIETERRIREEAARRALQGRQ